MPRTRVLVVDDDPLALRIIVRYLESAGYDVSTAQNGREAFHKLVNETVRLVITDWDMPEMNGLDLCRAIRGQEGMGFIYAIILTAHADEESLVEAFENGADDYVCKPCKKKELLARIRAGERIISLQAELEGKTLRIARVNAEAEVAARELERANQMLARMATTDELTGLINRRAAMDRLDEQWLRCRRYGEPMACIMIDIDHFKRVNDTYGHATGDRVLESVAAELRYQSRKHEAVCRIGGEEFLVLCASASARDARVAAERLRQAVERIEVNAGDGVLRVTISVGVAEVLPEMRSPEELTRLADLALYESKQSGRNRTTVFDNENQSIWIERFAGGERDADGPARVAGVDAHEHDATVLVVEHAASTRSRMRLMLEAAGFRVAECATGDEAIAQVTECAPDIVVIDIDLPRIDGLATTRVLKANPGTRAIPVVLLGWKNDAASEQRAQDVGADHFVSKPIQSTELIAAVRAVRQAHARPSDIAIVGHSSGEQARLLARLLDYSRLIATAIGIEELLEHTVATVVELTGCRCVNILTPDRGLERLTMTSRASTPDPSLSHVEIAFNAGVVGEVFATSLVVACDEAEAAKRLAGSPDAGLFLPGPILSVPLVGPEDVVGVMNMSGRIDNAPFKPYEREIVDLVSHIAGSSINDLLARRSRDEARDSIVVALAKLAQHRDDDTGKHLERVTQYCLMLARALRQFPEYGRVIDECFMSDLKRAVPLHDIGKVAIPDAILQKPGRLTPEEMAVMQTHTVIGGEVIRSVAERVPDARFLNMAEQIAISHHERIDGKGYPYGLVGEQIPLAARIVTLADVYDAITSERVYKKAMPHEDAVRIIVEGRGTQFDATIVACFRSLEHKFAALGRQLCDAPEGGSDGSTKPDRPGRPVLTATL